MAVSKPYEADVIFFSLTAAVKAAFRRSIFALPGIKIKCYKKKGPPSSETQATSTPFQLLIT